MGVAALRVGLCVGALLAAAAGAAEPTGTLQCPAEVPLLDGFDCTLTLSVDADAVDVTVVPVAVQLPAGGKVLRVAESPELRYLHDQRRFVGDVPLRPGQPRRLRLSMVLTDLGPHQTQALDLAMQGRRQSVALQLPSWRPTDLGLWRWPWPPWLTGLGLLALPAGLFVALRGWARNGPRGLLSARGRASDLARGTPGGGAALVVVLLAPVLLTLPVLVDNVRSRFTFDAARCQVLDSARVQFSEDSRPVLALRFSAAGQERVSAGYSSWGRSLPDDRAEDFLRLAPGSELPCWYDPLHPERVDVVRGISALALVGGGLPVLLVLALRRLALIRRFE
jgi:hypothetical protein